ncbi:MAG TPA: VPLPA-CTERM sorting domain-containing protein [Gammaproteobacteria bacterium]|nr:VPLPA-CTERM sorting domain-containing protein [Gammaproteobacteria bacterium]
MRSDLRPLPWLLLLVTPCVFASPVTYTDRDAYLQALSNQRLAYIHEGFESDVVWGSYRSSVVIGFNTADSVTSRGVTWASNFPGGGVTTSEGAAEHGNWGMYSYPHGSYTPPRTGVDCSSPGTCGDGFTGTAATGTFYAVGGLIDTNTPYAKLGMFLGNYPTNPVDFGETCDSNNDCVSNAIIGTAKAFFGIIDTDGFQRFEFRELEGTVTDVKTIFADDFYIAESATVVPLPESFWLLGSGLLGLVGIRRRHSRGGTSRH